MTNKISHKLLVISMTCSLAACYRLPPVLDDHQFYSDGRCFSHPKGVIYAKAYAKHKSKACYEKSEPCLRRVYLSADYGPCVHDPRLRL